MHPSYTSYSISYLFKDIRILLYKNNIKNFNLHVEWAFLCYKGIITYSTQTLENYIHI